MMKARNGGHEPPPPPPAPPLPPPPDVWDPQPGATYHYFVRSPWKWVMDQLATESMTAADNVTDLPSAKVIRAIEEAGHLMTPMTPMTPSTRRRRGARKGTVPSTLKIEICDRETGLVTFAAHGNSTALDGLEDKDELVRTMQRCRCDNLNLSPPSILINWDVSHDECLNVVGIDLPALETNKDEEKVAVLKEPLGSQGSGIYFVRTVDEIHKIINEHRLRAQNENALLDSLIERKGRIPSWVLQAEVMPCLLIKGRRKFHIRTYVIAIENSQNSNLVDMYIFNRHEVRIAGAPVKENDPSRDRLSHITNGALSNTTERVLLHEVEELTSRNVQPKLEAFVAEFFGKHVIDDISRRISVSIQQEEPLNWSMKKFAVAGLDLMLTEQNRIFLLEVNVNPAAPPEHTVNDSFKEHLLGFMKDLVDLVMGANPPTFVSSRSILEANKLS